MFKLSHFAFLCCFDDARNRAPPVRHHHWLIDARSGLPFHNGDGYVSVVMAGAEAIVATLRAHAEDLRRRGIAHAGVFGSTARGEDRPDSDVDIMVELDPGVGILAFSEVRIYLSELLGRRVDLVTPGGLRALARSGAVRNAMPVF